MAAKGRRDGGELALATPHQNLCPQFGLWQFLDKRQEEFKPESLALTNFLALGKNHQLIEMAVNTRLLLQESNLENKQTETPAIIEYLTPRRVFRKTSLDLVDG